MWLLPLAYLLLAMPARAAPTIYLADSPAAQELVDEAASLQDQDRLTDAVDRLQQVITEYPHRLMEVEPDRHEDALRWVRRRLREDPELLEAYESAHGARAERRYQAALSPRLDPAALEQVLARYATTEAGLEAGLALAAAYLERAAAHSAASVLDELADHPRLDRHAARYHHLQAAAGLLTGDPQRHEHHTAQLRETGQAAPLDALDSLAAHLTGPVRPATPPLRAVDEALPNEAMEGPLWQGAADWTPMGPSNAEMPSGRFGRTDSEDQPVPILPVADARRIYLNQGDRLRALDRDSGWELWSHQWEGVDVLGELPAMVRMRGGNMMHERGALRRDGRVYAVLGAATLWPSRWNQGGSATALVSVDQTSGEPAWSVTPGELDASLEEAYFVGTPQAGDDRIFALLRRSQASGFKDTFLLAVAPDTGELIWRRHIAAAAMSSRFNAGPRPRMTTADGRVYVADNLGAVAALDQRTGTVQWLRLLGDAEQTSDREQRARRGTPRQSEGDGAKPLRCAAGLLVRDPEDGAIHLLDPRTGRQRRALDGRPWNGAHAMLPAGDQALVVGAGALTLVDGASLETQWRHTLEHSGAPASPRGQIALTRDHVFYALAGQLTVLGRIDGQVLQRRDVTTPANLLPLEAQIVLVDGESIRSFTSWSRAAARLRERMAETPADPSPALALAQLAARRGERQIIIDGVDQALTALRTAQRAAAERDTDQAQRVQQRTFAQVLDLARHEALDRLDQSAELREMLFDRVAMITSGPAQEVAYHLAVGRFLAAQRPREAVEHLQVVLADEVLSAQLYEAAPVSRQAGLEANQRLRALIEKHGRAIYATYEQRAARELERLAAQRADTEALIALAERYPLAAAASEALVRAAGQLAERDRLPAAVEQLRRARERAPTPAQRGRVVGQTAALYQAHGEPGRAIAWLHRLQREHPEVAPVRDGEPVSIDDWLSQLERMEPGAGSLPALALPLDQPRLVSGRLLAAPREHWAMAQRDVLLVERDGMLQRYEPGELALRWQREATFDQARLVGADERLLLLWSPRRHELIALDDATGEPAWAKLDATALLEEVGDARDRAAARAADRRRFEDLLQQRPVRLNRGQPMQREQDGDDEAQRFAVVGASSVALADHMGRVVGVDRRRGEVRWQLMSAIERITHARVRHDTLALAGVIGPGADTATGAIAVLDLRTGERIMPVIEDKQIPRWIGFAGDRLLLVASDDRITAYRLGSGAVAWRARVTDTALADVGWASERLVMLRDERGVGHLFDAETGERRQRLHLDAQLGRRAVSIDPVEQRWYVHTTDGLTCLDGSGAVQWRDGITEGPFAALTHLVTREHIVLLTQRRAAVGGDDAPAPPWVIRPGEAPIRERIEPAQPEPEQPDADDAEVGEADEAERFRHHLYLLDRRTGALVAEHPLGPLPHGLSAEGAAAQQNRLIVPTAGQTLVVPGGDAASN